MYYISILYIVNNYRISSSYTISSHGTYTYHDDIVYQWQSYTAEFLHTLLVCHISRTITSWCFTILSYACCVSGTAHLQKHHGILLRYAIIFHGICIEHILACASIIITYKCTGEILYCRIPLHETYKHDVRALPIINNYTLCSFITP